MGSFYQSFVQKLLFTMDAERAHGLSIQGLKAGFYPRVDGAEDKRLGVDVAGLHFPNPFGMAAGYDKNGDVFNALLAMGFGHSEVGTITPKPQAGNPKPRIFRLIEEGAVINRLGFNSKGHEAAYEQLQGRDLSKGIVGVNIGANKTSEDFAADYVAGIHCFASLASYFTVNISSPNTPGLRALQGANPLADLLQRVEEARLEQSEKIKRRPPIFLKIAPDLDEDELDTITYALQNSAIDGLIVSNTTLSRMGLVSNNKGEMGGLSGRPLFKRSTIVLAKMYQRLGPDFPLIGVGGVDDGQSALEKIEAGARLVQLYTGLIYKGPNLPQDLLKAASQKLDAEGLSSIASLVGNGASRWAGQKLLP